MPLGKQISMEVDNLREGYVAILDWVIQDGNLVKPRGLYTREVLGASIVLTNPRDALPQGVGRRLHTPIGAVEAAQLIAGRAYPQLTCKVSRHFEAFMDGEQFHGSYGPRIISQREHVVRKLREDPSDRRALMTIWNPQVDNEPDLHDYPCTTVLQFMIRASRLDMQVYMRSNDAWRGLAYDAFQFTQLQHSVALELGLKVGVYRHFAASLHIYDSDIPAARNLITEFYGRTEPVPDPDLRPQGLTVGQARRLLANECEPAETLTESVRWYQEKLGPYLNA